MFDATTLSSGAVLAGRYKIESLLGRGGSGSVFVALDLVSGMRVALKVLRSTEPFGNPLRRRFEREAQAIAQLDHPNIVRIHEYGYCDDGGPYICLELVDGVTLGVVIVEGGPLPERESLRLMAQVADGLSAAHAQGIVHRDLKPTNVIVRRLPHGAMHAKVVDFGLAKLLGSEVTSLTAPGHVLGTPHYVSPEQAIGAGVDGRSDLYSLGCVMHAVLTGAPPFDSAKVNELLECHVRLPAPGLPSRLADGAAPTPGLIAMHRALLAKAALARPVDAAIVARILGALAEGHSVDVLAQLEEARKQAFASSLPSGQTMATLPSQDGLHDLVDDPPVVQVSDPTEPTDSSGSPELAAVARGSAAPAGLGGHAAQTEIAATQRSSAPAGSGGGGRARRSDPARLRAATLAPLETGLHVPSGEAPTPSVERTVDGSGADAPGWSRPRHVPVATTNVRVGRDSDGQPSAVEYELPVPVRAAKSLMPPRGAPQGASMPQTQLEPDPRSDPRSDDRAGRTPGMSPQDRSGPTAALRIKKAVSRHDPAPTLPTTPGLAADAPAGTAVTMLATQGPPTELDAPAAPPPRSSAWPKAIVMALVAAGLVTVGYVIGRPMEPAAAPRVQAPTAPARELVALPAAEPELAPEVQAGIRVSSTPAGASVIVAGAVIGTTPVDLERPSAGTTQAIRIELAGHSPRTLTLASDAPDTLSVRLTPQSRRKKSSAKRTLPVW